MSSRRSHEGCHGAYQVVQPVHEPQDWHDHPVEASHKRNLGGIAFRMRSGIIPGLWFDFQRVFDLVWDEDGAFILFGLAPTW